VIRTAFEQLRRGAVAHDDEGRSVTLVSRPNLAELLATREPGNVEFKSSAFYSFRPEVPERVVTDSVVKTVAGFLNADGGTLAIGVADDGEVLGVEVDLDHKGVDLDRYVNALTGLLERALGGAVAARVQIVVERDADASVCLVHVPPSREPVYASVGRGEEVFFVRTNNSTRILAGPELVAYVRDRWA